MNFEATVFWWLFVLTVSGLLESGQSYDLAQLKIVCLTWFLQFVLCSSSLKTFVLPSLSFNYCKLKMIAYWFKLWKIAFQVLKSCFNKVNFTLNLNFSWGSSPIKLFIIVFNVNKFIWVLLWLLYHRGRLKFLRNITIINPYKGKFIRNLRIHWQHMVLILIVFNHTCLGIFFFTIFTLSTLITESPLNLIILKLTKSVTLNAILQMSVRSTKIKVICVSLHLDLIW